PALLSTLILFLALQTAALPSLTIRSTRPTPPPTFVPLLLPIRPPPSPPLFPYTTLFRSPAPRAGRPRRRSGRRRSGPRPGRSGRDRKSTRLNSSHQITSYAVFCLKKKTTRFSPPTC